MTRTYPFRRLAAAAAAVAALGAAPAHAMLVLQSEEIFSGTGLGNVSTVLTLQGQGNATFEQGSVSYDGSADVLSGNALSGASQTTTRTIDEVGLTSAADLRIVFNAQEPGNVATNSISLTNLSLSIFSPTGALLFNSGSLTDAPINFADTFTGTGNSGFVFALDAEQAAAAQAAGFSGDYGDNRIGLFASLSNATGGPETFFVGNAGGVTPPIPEPETYALMLAGLGVVGFVARRRRRRG